MKIEQIALERGYFVSEDGNLYNKKGKKIGSDRGHNGYLSVKISYNKGRKNLFIHRLQAFQKYGKSLYEEGILTRHLDGNKQNNSWSNIAIGTSHDNTMDIPEQIRISRSKHAASFLKKHNYREIADFYNTCKSYKKTMEEFNITSKGTLHYILNN